VLEAHVDHLILVGLETQPLEAALGGQIHVRRAADADEAAMLLSEILRPGDAVLVKASNSVGLARVVEQVAGGRQVQSCSTS
jgi:UDP-N-acetylmuramoyl-tripeptide--D-alanyl-D-alanine ligase